MLDDFSNATGRQTPDIITEKVASMSCKAAVKGNDKLTLPEINKLIDELLSLDNPYNCPHGRPTIISMSKYEIEKEIQTYRMTTYTFGLRCNMTQKPMIVLTGPTAVGKTALSIELAKKINGAIISAIPCRYTNTWI